MLAKVVYTYDTAGQALTETDQNGTEHTYGYDALGRQISDSVTIAAGNPENIDTSILRIETSYNGQGLTNTVTSYSSATGGSGAIVNQIQDVYNGLGQLTQEFQSHTGAVNTSSTLSVSYSYASGSQGSRLTSMTYPSGEVLNYQYGTSNGLNDIISRLDSMVGSNDSGGTMTLQSYVYLGLSTVVEMDDPQDGVNLSYMAGGHWRCRRQICRPGPLWPGDQPGLDHWHRRFRHAGRRIWVHLRCRR